MYKLPIIFQFCIHMLATWLVQGVLALSFKCAKVIIKTGKELFFEKVFGEVLMVECI